MYRILTLNNIAKVGLGRLPGDHYQVGIEIADPDAILVRSANMHAIDIPATLKAVGRAGAGVNNIPVAKMSARGIPVFNAPGANSNAVKELVIAGLIVACRQLCAAWDFARGLEGSDEEIGKAVEAGKKGFAGFELPNRTLGVVGLGAIGRLVANTGVSLGMNVIGFDPGLTVEGAWALSSSVHKARSLDEVFQEADFLTVHVPLIDATRHMVNAQRLASMRKGAVILNFAREGIVDDQAVVDAIDAGHIHGYVCDFPTNTTKNHARCVTLPHLGASTVEAEDNCAIMVADQVRDFLENGNVRNAVNFPEVVVARRTAHRFVCANANVPNMLSRISETFGQAGLNIHNMVNSSKGDLAYTIVDLDTPVPAELTRKLAGIEGVVMTRLIDVPRA
ncbi:MAG: 3-phosphoglycerate dehydrogenase [Acidobacteria bacterium SCN 69-37]|nr:MAG: 3-phosphoglycerate dehydrogenase [Acidobacteria bacterium SCN 69-37]